MAQRTTVTMIDDLTKEEGGDIETVPFAIDGVEYTVDLNGDNALELRDFLSTYVEAGQRVGGRKTTGRRAGGATSGSTKTRYSRETSSHQREWARSQGFTVSDRGRLPGDALAAWEQAHPTQVAG